MSCSHAVTVVPSTPASVCTTIDEERERRWTAIVGVMRKDNSCQRRRFGRLASTTVVVPDVVLQIRSSHIVKLPLFPSLLLCLEEEGK